MTYVYSLIVYDIQEHESFLLGENHSFIRMVNKINQLQCKLKTKQDVQHINFYLKKTACCKFRTTHDYAVNKSL